MTNQDGEKFIVKMAEEFSITATGQRGFAATAKKADGDIQCATVHVSDEIQGYLRHFGLIDWWLTALSEQERKRLDNGAPLGGQPHPLTHGHRQCMGKSATWLLYNLAEKCLTLEDRSLARRILAKAEEVWDGRDILSLHFTYKWKIQINYKDRHAKPLALALAITACEQQIALAPQAAVAFRHEWGDQSLPRHKGYEQLARLREKQGNVAEALRLSQEALDQGWDGDWKKGIERCRQKGNQ